MSKTAHEARASNSIIPPPAIRSFLVLSHIFNMLAEEFFSSVCGPALTSNTAIAKDVGIYSHSLWPTFAAKSTFRKSATAPNCLAANDTHVFAAQHEKGYVHVYSRLRGNQEAFVAFPERIRCLTLAGGVVVVGTVEGRIMLWEVSVQSSKGNLSVHTTC